jgi:hypothetical protein
MSRILRQSRWKSQEVRVRFNFILSHSSEEEDFYRFDLFPEYGPWLESDNGPALRTLLAGLIGDRGILRQRRRSVASFGGKWLRRIEPMLSPQPSFTPPCPTSGA